MPRKVEPSRGRYPEPVEISAHTRRRERVSVVVSVSREWLDGGVERPSIADVGHAVYERLREQAGELYVMDAGEERFDPDRDLEPGEIDDVSKGEDL